MTTLRPARQDESHTLAKLYSIAGGGVADYVWSLMAAPGEDPLDVGARRYARDDLPMGYRNCTVAVDTDGRLSGMIVAFEMIRDRNNEMDLVDPVLRPYAELEASDTLYISDLAVFPEYRGRGIGERFLDHAQRRAIELDLSALSLLVFEENAGALRLYRRRGFSEVDRRAVVPHPIIRHRGACLLMTLPVSGSQPGATREDPDKLYNGRPCRLMKSR